MKRCSVCGMKKPLSKFYNRKEARDGKRADCITCNVARKKLYDATDRGKKVRKKAIHSYNVSPKGHENRDRYTSKKYNKLKLQARGAVSMAVRRKKLPRVSSLVCNNCDNQAQHYHHNSYEKGNWLDVIPMCVPCHTEAHRGSDSTVK